MKCALLCFALAATTQVACGPERNTNITPATLTAVKPRVLVPGASDAGVPPPAVIQPAGDAGMIDEGPEVEAVDVEAVDVEITTPGVSGPTSTLSEKRSRTARESGAGIEPPPPSSP
jgi:hypothetical protein